MHGMQVLAMKVTFERRAHPGHPGGGGLQISRQQGGGNGGCTKFLVASFRNQFLGEDFHVREKRERKVPLSIFKVKSVWWTDSSFLREE